VHRPPPLPDDCLAVDQPPPSCSLLGCLTGADHSASRSTTSHAGRPAVPTGRPAGRELQEPHSPRRPGTIVKRLLCRGVGVVEPLVVRQLSRLRRLNAAGFVVRVVVIRSGQEPVGFLVDEGRRGAAWGLGRARGMQRTIRPRCSGVSGWAAAILNWPSGVADRVIANDRGQSRCPPDCQRWRKGRVATAEIWLPNGVLIAAWLGARRKSSRAADAQQPNPMIPHESPRPRPSGPVQWPAAQGVVVGVMAGIPRWHARGQGFKSPQLHQAQRHSRPPA
jgi:hypothetical protein